ncbi:Formamidopyrimidine-DNA glycosylase [hydrothermal vent metagenome]|uniref:Formamidopyrimidine-DNA glycosylase n=1 Tax=hydrothermal vent metagenome TaxID=652676 RepID=A0A3B1BNN5_9ZZZZ
MPELPEVETTRRGLEPHLLQQRITKVIIRNRKLRWPVPSQLARELDQKIIRAVLRRGKYLLLRFDHGNLILHLGMSGSLRILPIDSAPQKHDHVEWQLGNGQCLRLRDPRRFGAVLWTRRDPLKHKLLAGLGPEPLLNEFDGEYLFKCSRGRKQAIKPFIMDSKIVVGVGNIYASEALFMAGIHPLRAAGRISLKRHQQLSSAIKNILAAAIRQGGTTLRDFTDSDGSPGYFKQQLKVYGRDEQACANCARPIRQRTIGQRASYYCPHCQT